MMIENNANEESIDKWTAKTDEKVQKIEQPIPDIEEAMKNSDRRKSIGKKNQGERRFEKRI